MRAFPAGNRGDPAQACCFLILQQQTAGTEIRVLGKNRACPPVHHPLRVNLKRSHQQLQLCVLTDINRLIELIFFSQYIQNTSHYVGSSETNAICQFNLN